MDLIAILWGDGKVKTNDSLVTRKEVLKVIGDTKVNTTLLRDLYKKLLELDYIYKRVGYFAKIEL
jgi:alpha-D-ribose 1-methylphosphonate 5-phosphate C-P lyase